MNGPAQRPGVSNQGRHRVWIGLVTAFGAAVAMHMALPSVAHHSLAMFDTQKQAVLSGTVREFQFTNPHCFIQLVVPDGTGTVEWSIEMASPAHLIRSGWNRNTVKPGDRLTVTINPDRAGDNGGRFVSAVGADGKTIGGST